MLTAILCLSPALVLALPLLWRRFPGERVLLTLRARRPIRHSRALARVAPPRQILLVPPRGGLLLARALAVRPPPACAPAS